MPAPTPQSGTVGSGGKPRLVCTGRIERFPHWILNLYTGQPARRSAARSQSECSQVRWSLGNGKSEAINQTPALSHRGRLTATP